MRKLSKISKLSIEDLIVYIINEFHKPLRDDLDKLEKYISKISLNLKFKNKMILPKEIFKQFKSEFINHINEEEKKFFPEIINLKKWNSKNISKIKRFLHLQKIEHNEIDSYLIWWKDILDNLDSKENEDIIEIKRILEKIYKDTADHTYIENNYLNWKVENLVKENEKK